jgi:hypothetical protein
MDMENFRDIVGKRKAGGGFQADPNSLTQRVLNAIPESDVISENDLKGEFNDVDAKKMRRVLSNLTSKKGKAKKRKAAKGYDKSTGQYFYTRNPEFLAEEDTAEEPVEAPDTEE